MPLRKKGARCNLLDLGWIITSIHPEQHLVFVLQYIGKRAQKICGIVSMEVA